ncbi:unnamed protein product [Meloidogyne enterolobii]|uniref:Uncharacterized protein n=1 Tax=Meloidogyne enterolobii TaxID=390850 RepID=A0ACB1B392_MELEN
MLGSDIWVRLGIGGRQESYKMGIDSRAPSWTRGFIGVPCRGPGDTRVGAGEVVDCPTVYTY